jgi:hypothetical protein
MREAIRGHQRSLEVIRRHQRSSGLRAEQHVALLVSMQSADEEGNQLAIRHGLADRAKEALADEEGNQLMRRAISMQSDTYSLIEPRKRSL